MVGGAFLGFPSSPSRQSHVVAREVKVATQANRQVGKRPYLAGSIFIMRGHIKHLQEEEEEQHVPPAHLPP